MKRLTQERESQIREKECAEDIPELLFEIAALRKERDLLRKILDVIHNYMASAVIEGSSLLDDGDLRLLVGRIKSKIETGLSVIKETNSRAAEAVKPNEEE